MFIDKFGYPKIEKMSEEDIDYTYLKCLIDGKLNLTILQYPLILATTPEKYLHRIKMAIDAEKRGLKYINLTGDSGSRIIVFANPININKVQLFDYLSNKYRLMRSDIINPIDFILSNLMGFKETHNRRIYLSRYIQEVAPKIAGFPSIRKPMKSKEDYMTEYNFVKAHDNFAGFEQFYEDIRKQAGKLLKDVAESEEFKERRAAPIKDFKFSIKGSIQDNPLYESVKKDVEKLINK